MPNWMTFRISAAEPQKVEQDTIYGAKIVSEGEAKGHGVHLDSEFLDAVTAFGANAKAGLKARFGHPNMCSTALGTFLGRWKNFRRDGSSVRADLHISASSHKTPTGDLGEYVQDLANDSPDMFGTSIVFSPGELYKRNEDGEKVYNEDPQYRKLSGPEYVECGELHAADVVDEPAANDGLFSASEWSRKTLSGQVTEFLDTHPEVMDLLREQPEIVNEFLARYENTNGVRPVENETEKSNETEALESEETTDVVEDGAPECEPENQIDEPVSTVPSESEKFAEAVESLTEMFQSMQKSYEDLSDKVSAMAEAMGGTPAKGAPEPSKPSWQKVLGLE